MSTFYSVPRKYMKRGSFALSEPLEAWLKDQCDYKFFMDHEYGPVLYIEDELIALQFKLAFEL